MKIPHAVTQALKEKMFEMRKAAKSAESMDKTPRITDRIAYWNSEADTIEKWLRDHMAPEDFAFFIEGGISLL